MNSKARIVFVYCWDDPWIAVIAGDLRKVSAALGHEFYVIAAGRHSALHDSGYINCDFLRSHYFFRRLFESLPYHAVDLSAIAVREYRLQRQHPAAESESEQQIKRKLRLWLAEAMQILKITQPDVVIVWNGMLSKWAVYAEAARFLNIPVYYAEKGFLPDSWYMDSKGINGASSIAEREFNLHVSEQDIAEFKSSLRIIDYHGTSAWEQPCRKNTGAIREDLDIKNKQKVIFFPGQVDSDSNIILFSDYFRNSLDALSWLVKGLSKDEFFIVAKPHPKGTLSEGDFKKVLSDRGKVVTEVNVLDAIELADCIVSINSTITFEAAIRGKPVLLLGKGVLNGKEYVSTYKEGVGARVQVMECIERYENDKDALYEKAIMFAAHLNSAYYTYRGNYSKTLHLLKHVTAGIHLEREKVFAREEIAAFFRDVSTEDLQEHMLQGMTGEAVSRRLPGKIIAQALWKKIRNILLR